jgi:uncharacterized membrane protein YkoI
VRVIIVRNETRLPPASVAPVPPWRSLHDAASTLEESMLARNALVTVVATALAASAAAAQQPAKPAAPAPRSAIAHSQAPGAKKNAKTSATAALAVNADSAKKVVMANAPGAKVTSERLHRSGGKSYYAVSYRVKGASRTMHANVDANTGAFTTSAPAAAPDKSATPPKKPS